MPPTANSAFRGRKDEKLLRHEIRPASVPNPIVGSKSLSSNRSIKRNQRIIKTVHSLTALPSILFKASL